MVLPFLLPAALILWNCGSGRGAEPSGGRPPPDSDPFSDGEFDKNSDTLSTKNVGHYPMSFWDIVLHCAAAIHSSDLGSTSSGLPTLRSLPLSLFQREVAGAMQDLLNHSLRFVARFIHLMEYGPHAQCWFLGSVVFELENELLIHGAWRKRKVNPKRVTPGGEDTHGGAICHCGSYRKAIQPGRPHHIALMWI